MQAAAAAAAGDVAALRATAPPLPPGRWGIGCFSVPVGTHATEGERTLRNIHIVFRMFEGHRSPSLPPGSELEIDCFLVPAGTIDLAVGVEPL